MITDTVGRTIQKGDVVLVTYSAKCFEIGTLVNDKIRTLSTISRAPSSYVCYLLENPTQAEIDERDRIIEKVNERVEKQKQENRGKKEYGKLLGGIYSTKEGNIYLYLGNLKLSQFNAENKLTWQRHGNCYYRIGTECFIKYRNIDVTTITNEFFEKQFLGDLIFTKGFKQVTGLYAIHSRFKMSDYRDIIGEYNYSYNDYSVNPACHKIGKLIVELNI